MYLLFIQLSFHSRSIEHESSLLQPSPFSRTPSIRPSLCHRPFRFAICGGGPAGFYSASRLLSLDDSERITIDLFERLPTPFGLSRYGVAPDHPKVKNCERKFEDIAQDGAGVTIQNLKRDYDVVILAYGASLDRSLGGLPGENDLLNVIAARQAVYWYNGYPSRDNNFVDLSQVEHVTIIGQGNVALDIARILLTHIDVLAKTDISSRALEGLAQSRVKQVDIIGRRGPLQVAFTSKELREMLALDNLSFHTDESLLLETIEHLKQPGAIESLSNSRMRKKLLELMYKASQKQSSSNDQSRLCSIKFLQSPLAFLAGTPSPDYSPKVGSVQWQLNQLVYPKSQGPIDYSTVGAQYACLPALATALQKMNNLSSHSVLPALNYLSGHLSASRFLPFKIPERFNQSNSIQDPPSKLIPKIIDKTPCFFGLKEIESKVRSVLVLTVSENEENVLLLSGPRGSVKTTMNLGHFRSLSLLSHPCLYESNGFITIKLNGFVHANDKLALKDMAYQEDLDSDNQAEQEIPWFTNYGETLKNLFEVVEPQPSFSRDEGPKSKALVIIVEEFDLFTKLDHQALLYCLLDAVQGKKRRGGLCIIGTTVVVDCLDRLEKRVESRCQSRIRYLNFPTTDKERIKLLRSVLESSIGIFSTDLFTQKWNEDVESADLARPLDDYRSLLAIFVSYKNLTPCNDCHIDAFDPCIVFLVKICSVVTPTDLVIKSLGYQSTPIDSIPFDYSKSLVQNQHGWVINENNEIIPGLYVTGWSSRGPSGVIANTMYDAFQTMDIIADDLSNQPEPSPRSSHPELINAKYAINWNQWKKIDNEERRQGRIQAKPREKILAVEEMLEIAGIS
ncbi:hypothetical protein O181_000939 [Austropuccinia psidii MF-1]|uniref:NADPH:adrenodoxin oxidoreductase, mitochondrial n=1 Tax=Austropuccinia psidii MF-1 TaxID=1389203 RepID=A0A9Q3B9I0_9BASI|nr:hypothetical protein [Austropuccinia psidii MF-1]